MIHFLLAPDSPSALKLKRLVAEQGGRTDVIVGSWPELLMQARKSYRTVIGQLSDMTIEVSNNFLMNQGISTSPFIANWTNVFCFNQLIEGTFYLFGMDLFTDTAMNFTNG